MKINRNVVQEVEQQIAEILDSEIPNKAKRDKLADLLAAITKIYGRIAKNIDYSNNLTLEEKISKAAEIVMADSVWESRTFVMKAWTKLNNKIKKENE